MEDLANFARLQSLLTEKDKAELQANSSPCTRLDAGGADADVGQGRD